MTVREKRGAGKSARTLPVGSKVNAKERAAILALAHQYAGGSVSRWARIAMLNYRPPVALNDNEEIVLRAAVDQYRAQRGGYVLNVDIFKRISGFTRRQFSGYLSALCRKGFLTMIDPRGKFNDIEVNRNALELFA